MILALKWKENLHTSICWRQHFISFLKHSPHLLSINQELLFRFSICFLFFSFSFIRIHGKLDLFQYAINIKDIWLKESELKEVLKDYPNQQFPVFSPQTPLNISTCSGPKACYLTASTSNSVFSQCNFQSKVKVNNQIFLLI